MVRLGDYIEECNERNSEEKFGIDDVRGISILKKIIPTKADMGGVPVLNYKIVHPNQFVFNVNTARMGDKFAIALCENDCIVSSIYGVFKSKDEEILDPAFLFLWFKREDFDRYVRFNSWGSARETFTMNEMSNVQIPLPPISVQRRLVAVYNGLKNLAEQNEALIAPLSNACQAFVVDCKEKYNAVRLGEYIKRGRKNSDEKINRVLGIGQSGFIEPQKEPNKSLRNYKVMEKGNICYAPPLYNILSDAIHLYNNDFPAVCSPIYEVLEFTSDEVLPEFVMLWLKRPDFKRYAEFFADGVRNTFSFDEMSNVQIPLPPITVQRSIVNLYRCMEEAKAIAAAAREQMKTVCPALVQLAMVQEH